MIWLRTVTISRLLGTSQEGIGSMEIVRPRSHIADMKGRLSFQHKMLSLTARNNKMLIEVGDNLFCY